MDIMKSNTNRLLNLINNIIDTSKIENGKYKITKSKEDIDNLLKDLDEVCQNYKKDISYV